MIQLIFEVNASSLYGVLIALDAAMDVDEIVQDAATIILNNTRNRFLLEQDPSGHKWPASQAAKDRRSALDKNQRGGTGTLFDTGALWRSIQQPAQSGAQGNLFGDFAEAVITAGALNSKGVEYGHFHQEGTKHLPQRRFMGVNKGDQELFEGRLLQRAAQALGVG